ncbi:MAG TPA: rhodanese-like domain-containing protein [Gemmatimonadales bacterium]|nr:rhodanese-like domain-containing protein [Gemmatimonadales bacterium]
MIFRRFYDESLAQASYLIGCAGSGEAVVVDPNRLVDQYMAAAESEGVHIVGVAETHIHADYLSGTRELAARTGAQMYLSACGTPDWHYAFASDPKITLLREGDEIRVGNVALRAVHTPGHTPEHLSFLVTDGAVATEPMGACTGDFVFVGDVGRPDLLEKAAKVAGASDSAARDLWRSLEAFKTHPDHLQIWPGHGAGSACGKGLSAMPQSTLGYERRYNWAFGAENEDEFVAMVLAGQPEPPRYFGIMKRLNREGPALLGSLPSPERVKESLLRALLKDGAVVVDTRPASAFAAEHVPGTLNIPLNKSFTTWAGSLLPYDRDLYLIMAEANADAVEAAVRNLVLIGLDRVTGYLGAEAVSRWAQSGQPTGSIDHVSVADLRAGSNGALIVDVRAESEWDAGHLPGAIHIPLPELEERLGEIPTDRDVVTHCQGGGRSAIAASLLKARGYDRVANLAGGYSAWVAAGLPVER